MVVLIAELQGECDTHANTVIDMFKTNTSFSEKVTINAPQQSIHPWLDEDSPPAAQLSRHSSP